MINISFNLTKDDALALACHYYAASATVRKSRMALQIAVALIFAVAGLAIYSSDQLRPIGVALFVCAGLSTVYVASWHRSNLQKMAEKMFGESSYQKLFGEHTLVLTEQGLVSTSPTGGANYTWEAVDRVALTPEHLFIFLVGPQGFAIPRSQVSDLKIQEVKAFAESQIRK